MSSTDASDRTIDEKGRVTIPKAVREALGLEPGSGVRIEIEDDRIVLSPGVSSEAFVAAMEGCITEEMARADAPDIDPLDLKGTWTADLPASDDHSWE